MNPIISKNVSEKTILSLPLAKKVGQVCSPIFQASAVPDYLRDFVCEYGIGFVRYCINASYDNQSKLVDRPNPYLTPESNAALLNELQMLSIERGSGLPLVIGVDQEGGTRNDLNRYGALVFGSHMSFGCADDVALTEEAAFLTGRQMRAIGINLVQAPITDVFSYEGRTTMKAASFGEDPALVTRHALAMMRGYHRAGLAVMIKHFPGYGATAVDAHKSMAEVVKSLEALEAHDNIPIRELLAAGADAVMTGHVIVGAMDPGRAPATVSRAIIHGYLRKRLGFEGIVETDAMRMNAIQEKYGTARASVMALQAGCDVLLLRGDANHFLDGYRAVYDAVKSGALAESALDVAVLRIHRLRQRIKLYENALVPEQGAGEAFAAGAARRCVQAIADRSVVVLRDEAKRLPLRLAAGARLAVISPKPQKLDGADDPIQSEDMLVQAVRERFPDAVALLTELTPTDANLADARAVCEGADCVIVGSINAINFARQPELVAACLESGKPVIVVAMESPYDLGVYPQAQTCICTLGAGRDAMRSAVKIITGELQPSGRLPITLKL
ncbi:glycoside hydrolase family 3 protein [Geminisphaera colitermitum]|uniref:glycoside hydrolase family 3 protein n=1 Tax=Geminisphaera colitermitum TaxID=1148786 RepID=UPI000158D534|nr:glycoside hydrolase family 3 N-terminal domain-containing protein [Geminisphaera colitermitum]